MKLSTKIQKCELSPIRKYAPYAAAARARGIKIYPLNIGQPDIETPAAFLRQSVLSRAAFWNTRPRTACRNTSRPYTITISA